MADSKSELLDFMVDRLDPLMEAKTGPILKALERIMDMLVDHQKTLKSLEKSHGVTEPPSRLPPAVGSTVWGFQPQESHLYYDQQVATDSGMSQSNEPGLQSREPHMSANAQILNRASTRSASNDNSGVSPGVEESMETGWTVQMNDVGVPTIMQKSTILLHGRHARRIRRLVQGQKFDFFWLGLISFNALVIGAQLQHQASTGSEHWSAMPLNTAFTVLFVTELLLRCWGLGVRNFLCGPEWGWAWVDVLTVGVAIVDAGFSAGSFEASRLTSSFRVIRMFRVLRIARVIRGIRFLRDLRLLIVGMVNSMVAISWTVIAVVFIMYIGAVVVMSIVIDKVCDKEEYYVKTWGGVFTSMGTLFQVMSGDSWWSAVVAGIKEDYPGIQLFFVVYFCLTAYGLLNIVTGIFVDQTLGVSQNDTEFLRHKRDESAQMLRAFLKDIFQIMDSRGVGRVSARDFEQCLSRPQLQFALGQIDLKADDVVKLFVLLDKGGDGFVDAQEFVEGCMRMRGAPTTGDIIEHSLRTRRLLMEIQLELTRGEKNTNTLVNTLMPATDSVEV